MKNDKFEHNKSFEHLPFDLHLHYLSYFMSAILTNYKLDKSHKFYYL